MAEDNELKILQMNIARDLTVAFINRAIIPEIRKADIPVLANNIGTIYNIILKQISNPEVQFCLRCPESGTGFNIFVTFPGLYSGGNFPSHNKNKACSKQWAITIIDCKSYV